MRIVLLQDDFPPRSRGGAGNIAFEFAQAFLVKGHEVSIITAVQNREDEGHELFEGLNIFKIYSRYHVRWQGWRSVCRPLIVRKVRHLLKIIQPDVVHAHNIHYHLSYGSLKAAKRSGAKVFLTAHDAMLFHYGKFLPAAGSSWRISSWSQMREFRLRYNPFRNILIRHSLKNVSKVFAVSEALKKALIENKIQNVEVMHNGIDVSKWEVSEEAIQSFKTKHSLLKKKVIFFGGRLSEAKGGEQSVRMMANLIKKVPEAILMVAGHRGPYAQYMLKLAKSLEVEDRLLFVGWLSGDDLKAAYGSSNLVTVLSTYLDPFPTINLEAMACKKPVIATTLGGSKELVEDGKNGYVVDPCDIEILTERVTDLLLDTLKAGTFGEAGYQRVKEEFGLGQTVSNLLKQYHS